MYIEFCPKKGLDCLDLNVANDALEACDVNATPRQLQLQLQRDENRLRKRSSIVDCKKLHATCALAHGATILIGALNNYKLCHNFSLMTIVKAANLCENDISSLYNAPHQKCLRYTLMLATFTLTYYTHFIILMGNKAIKVYYANIYK